MANFQHQHDVTSTEPRSFYLIDANTQKPLADDAVTLVVGSSPTQSRNNSKDHEDFMPTTVRWYRIRSQWQPYFSEFWATFILVLFGDGAIAQVVLSGKANGDWLSICIGWGIGVMLGAYVGGQSGAHMNPAVTLAMCVYRGFSWKKLPLYALAQTLGAMLAALIIYGNYVSAINEFEGGLRTVPGYSTTATGGIFATYPTPFTNTAGQFFSECVATAMLVFCLFALLDNKNLGAKKFTPLGLFMILTGIAISFGWETGFAINPARDFGPRLISAMVGYHRQVFTASNYYFWVPVLAPCLGGTLGGFLYDIFLFSGESPINTPALGLGRLRQLHRKDSSPV